MNDLDVDVNARIVATVLAKAVKEGKISGIQWWDLVMLFAKEIDEITVDDYKE